MLYLLLTASLCSTRVLAQIQLSNNQELQFKSLDLSNVQTGDNLGTAIETSEEALLLSVNILPYTLENAMHYPWKIKVKRNDFVWHKQLRLAVKTTAIGNSEFGKSINSSHHYKEVQNYDTLFFSGEGWINNIPLQFRITGISVTLPANTYTTEVIFTITDD